MTDDTESVVGYLHEVGHLKRTKRAGWWIAGVRDPESVAEHSFRAGVIAYVLALMEGADPDRAATLALFHDVLETRIGDIPSPGRAHLAVADPVEIARTQTDALPSPVAENILGLVSEYEAKESPESQCAKDADKLECLLQAREYATQGYALVQPWVDTMVAAVKTPSGKELARGALSTPVDSWWRDIVSSYGSAPQAPRAEAAGA